MAIADTGSNLNFISPQCAEREGFHLDGSDSARISVQVGDGTLVETIGQVYICNLSLDWWKPVTENPRVAMNEPSMAGNSAQISLGTIFHVLPGLPCDVILAKNVLDEKDAFNCYPDLSCSGATSKKTAFEWSILLFKAKKKRKSAETAPDPKEAHDDERHAEMHRRSKRERERELLTGVQKDEAQATEILACRLWDARHAACGYCHPQNP